MANVQFSEAFLKAAGKSFFNASEWTPVGEAYSLKDIWSVTNPEAWDEIDGDVATVVETEFSDGSTALRIAIPFKDGSTVELKLSGKSGLEEGDKVRISSITGQELRKIGQDPILRYDGEMAE